MVEFGIIKKFKEGQNFGFVYVLDDKGQQTEEEVFLHYNDGRFVVRMEGREAIFTKNLDQNETRGERVKLAPPKVGDKIVFYRKPGDNLDKASPWGYVPVHPHSRVQRSSSMMSGKRSRKSRKARA